MLFKTEITSSVSLSGNLKSKVKIEKIEFTVVPENLNNGSIAYYVQEEKGDFEFLYIQVTENGYYGSSNQKSNVPYDQINKRFTCSKCGTFHFTILTDIEYKKSNKSDEYVKINYPLFVSSDFMKSLKLYEYDEDFIVLPGYNNLKFKRYIKKIKEKSVEIYIENPFEVEIGYQYWSSDTLYFSGKKEDYKVVADESANFNQKLCFILSIDDLKKYDAQPQLQNNIPNVNFDVQSQPPQNSASTGNLVPASKAPAATSATPSTTIDIQKPIFYEIMSSTKYADVNLVTSDGAIIPTHRCVLAKYSVIFDKMFEKSKEIPVKIQLEKFDADTVTAALNFCYGKIDSIVGKAGKLLEFANAFAINELKDACCYYCNEKVDPSNVCEVIQIAYSNNLEELKQKCIQIMIEKKAEIDQAKLKALPKDILFDVFCSV